MNKFIKSSPTKIDWAHRSANPATGCEHGCSYCYARQIARRYGESWGLPKDNPFRPTFHPERFSDKDGPRQPKRIFLGSMGDYGGDWVWSVKGKEYVNDAISDTGLWARLLSSIRKSKHTYITLTKNPHNLYKVLNSFDKIPDNLWVGASCVDQEAVLTHAYGLYKLKKEVGVSVVFISHEPALGHIDLSHNCIEKSLDWLIIGAQTGPQKIQPRRQSVFSIIGQAKQMNVPVFCKDNIVNHGELPKEFPK